jgi:hypothetical protein
MSDTRYSLRFKSQERADAACLEAAAQGYDAVCGSPFRSAQRWVLVLSSRGVVATDLPLLKRLAGTYSGEYHSYVMSAVGSA